MKENVIIIGRIKQGNKLIGGKFYNLSNSREYFVSIDKFEELFEKYNVLNCKYYNGRVYSRWNKFNLKGLNIYNIHRHLIKQGYNEKKIIVKANNIHTKDYMLISGGRILDPDSDEANTFAKKYYGQIRKMSRDVFKIAKNTGKSLEEIQRIKNYIFMDTHKFLDNRNERFEPDCAMAHSWQRLAQYVNEPIQPHDLIMLEHELLEMKLVNDGMPQEKAHIIASEKYDYNRYSTLYYIELKKREERKNVQLKKHINTK